MNPHFLASSTSEELIAALLVIARRMRVTDIKAEAAPAGFRIVRDNATPQGVLLSRHALIGLLTCLASVEVVAMGAEDLAMKHLPPPEAFWKEVLS